MPRSRPATARAVTREIVAPATLPDEHVLYPIVGGHPGRVVPDDRARAPRTTPRGVEAKGVGERFPSERPLRPE